MWHMTDCKISVSLLLLEWIKKEMIFYRISELMLALRLESSIYTIFDLFPMPRLSVAGF